MSSIVVDGSSQIKLIHSKWLIPSRWLGGWIEFHKIGVWARDQWAPFGFRADGGTGALGAEEGELCRAQGTGHISAPSTGWHSSALRGHRQGQDTQSWCHLYTLGSSDGFYTEELQLCLGQEPNILQTRGNPALLSVWWLFPWDPSCRDSGLWREVEDGWSLITGTETGPKWSPSQDSIFSISSAFAEAPAQKLMNGCSRKLFLPAVGSSYFAFNCAFTCLSLITVAAVEKCSFMNNKCSLGKKPPLCFRYQKPPDPLLSALQSLVFTNTFSILLNNDNSSVFTSLNYHILWKELIK